MREVLAGRALRLTDVENGGINENTYHNQHH